MRWAMLNRGGVSSIGFGLKSLNSRIAASIFSINDMMGTEGRRNQMRLGSTLLCNAYITNSGPGAMIRFRFEIAQH